MRIIIFSGLFFLLSFLSGCNSLPDIESGILGSWKCINVEYEIIKPDWIESDLGRNYEYIINKHISDTEATLFVFEGVEDEYRFISLGKRELSSNWKAIRASQTIDVSLAADAITHDFDYNSNTSSSRDIRVISKPNGYNQKLYKDLEVVSWEVKEFDAQQAMLVTETLGKGTVVFSYYLEYTGI